MERECEGNPDVARRREELDAAESRRRAETDRQREDERAVLDGTRQSARGTAQARDRLARERSREDASLGVERTLVDWDRRAERDLADAALGRERQARVDSDAALEERLDVEARRQATLRGALELLEEQIAVVDGSLGQLLATAPRGAFEGRLSDSLEKIRTAGLRMRRLLEDVLDPGDGRRRYHDEGGSG